MQELAQLYPAALVIKDNEKYTPLGCLIRVRYAPQALGILQVLLNAAPHTASMTGFPGRLPLHEVLSYEPSADMVAALLAAYKDAVDIADRRGMLPIHYAAGNASLEIFKMVAEANIMNLSIVSPDEDGSVAHCAVQNTRLDNLRFIHSQVPDILMSVNTDSKSVLHTYYEHSWNQYEFLRNRRWNTYPYFALSVNADVLRFLLRHCPSLSTAVDDQGKTVYDYITEEVAENASLVVYIRRLLLRAGASSQHPGVLEELNYAERRSALLCFFGTATELTIFSRISLSASGPELMRKIVSFL